MNIKPRRSVLYLPASNARAIAKSRSLDVDAIILDLEDSVAPEVKVEARAQAVAAVQEGGFGHRDVVIRVNGLDTPWGLDDLKLAATAGAHAILLPKVSSCDDIAKVRSLIGDNTDVWAMVETAKAIVDLPTIVATAIRDRLTTLVAGTNDLSKELHTIPGKDRAPLLAALSQIVLCARLHGLVALDGVINELEDLDAIESECRQGLAWGFDGKTLIHPGQIDIANRVFAPGRDEVEWARKISTAFDLPENRGKGALRIDGRMVEELHAQEARRTLAYAEALEARSVTQADA